MLTVIVSGRNDDYGGDFRERLFRTTLHNSARLYAAGVDFEYMLAEWNPIPGIPALSEEFVARTPRGRAVVVPAELHREYSLNSAMPFHEMAAKNVALRRARGSLVIVTNADILFGDELVCRLAAGGFASDTLYRAHRIDVDPKLRWDEMQDPKNQLSSGEGVLPPPWYLGAGGDFCLAARSLWHSLGGFNERIRFSTRAKDWQFFLSAAAQGVGVDFIGDVYHLDHEGGFRNTSDLERNSESAHFGRWWDIEFGLPVTNPAGWGFNGVRERLFANHPRISILAPDNSVIAEEQNQIDREMTAWLTPPDSPDTSTAFLIHAICAAHREHRRLICRIENPRLLVALSGLEAVASRYGVRICCNWKWPEISGYSLRPFEPEPADLQDADWIVEEHAGSHGGVRIYEHGSVREIVVLPTVAPVTDPEFNPVLARRLLRACLHLQSERGASRTKIAICGAGSHTRSLLQWGLPDNIEIVETVDSRSLSSLSKRRVDAVLLSSSSFESDMLEACRQQGISNVVALYNDWPKNVWELQTIGAGK